MARSPDVTAIVPTYNREEYLGDCLTSLLAQTTPPRQLIVMDDGSTDGTRDVIESFGSALEHHRQPNAGKAAALNRALTHARGDAIWIFDDDDVAVPEALELLSEALSARPDAGFSFGSHDNFSDDDESSLLRAPAADAAVDLDDLFHAILTKTIYPFQPAMLVRRRCYYEVGPFDASFPRAQDFDMLTRLAARYEATQIDAVLFHQRQHAGDRGPTHLRIDGREVWQRQYEFDVKVARKVRETIPVETFLPRRDRASSPAARAAGLLRRSAVMLRWSLWEEAAQDLRALANLPVLGSPIAPDIAKTYRHHAEHMGLAGGDGAEVIEGALSLPPGRLRDELVTILFWPHFRRGAKATMRGRLRSREAQALRSYGRRLPVGALLGLGRLTASQGGARLRRTAGLGRAHERQPA